MPPLISYAQNGEDIRVWRAFRDRDPAGLRYVDVGANEPWHLSITASLSELGWRGLLVEADPDLAAALRTFRPHDTVVECAASESEGILEFFTVPGTGLGTLRAHEAAQAVQRGFDTEVVTVETRPLDRILEEHLTDEDVHFMSIDVEGAEAAVLAGLDLNRHRPWVLCIEAIAPGSDAPSHEAWEPRLLEHGYVLAAFDGVNRWYVASEHAELVAAIATPFNALDAGVDGWVVSDLAEAQLAHHRAHARRAWQRELILGDVRSTVPMHEVEKQVVELRTALSLVEASRSWRYSRRLGRVGHAAIFRLRRLADRMPGPVNRWVIRTRHLRYVRANFPELTDPAYLGRASDESTTWINEVGLPPLPAAGFDLSPLSAPDAQVIREWLAAGPYDDDATLEARIDNHDDELGRVMAALRTRLRLATPPATALPASGNRVLVDARSLQSAAFGTRGIGRFAAAALAGVRESLGDEKIELLVDSGLEPLPESLRGACLEVTRVTEATVGRYSVLIQPSPMTASPDPILPLLHSTAHTIALVYDFIPMHYPSIYLRHAGARAEYAVALDALRTYDEFVCISHLARDELVSLLSSWGRADVGSAATVAWPASVDASRKVKAGTPSGPIIVMTGDEPRKNTYGALAAIGAATAGRPEPRDVLVVGMAGQSTRVHHWSIHAAMYPGETVTAERLTDEEMHQALRTASVVVVPSFDEGLSLPVIEAVTSGANVIASDIPAHRELLGRGSYLFDPTDLRAFSRTVRHYMGTRRGYPRQQAKLAGHEHAVLERVLSERALAHIGRTTTAVPPTHVHVSGRGPRLAFATPWTPQPSGVADFSATIGRELADLCDLTVYATSGAQASPGIAFRSVDELLADPRGVESRHDAVITVIGNSHFHTPFLEIMRSIDTIAVLHDTRLVEYYLALRGPGGATQVMLRGTGRSSPQPSLDEQIQDMRLLQNAGLWEVARRARALVMHAPSAAAMVAEQTGVRPQLLPFASQRVPDTAVVTEEMRRAAKARLGWDEGRIHLTSFGYVDIRTKMTDLVVETAAWLREWGHPVTLHLAGKASAPLEEDLLARARRAGIMDLDITGFLPEAAFRDTLLATDLGVQLRISPLLGVSGPLSDLAAWGTPAVASRGLAEDVDTPAYVTRLLDAASPLMTAEAVETALRAPQTAAQRESERQAYLAAKSPRRYAEGLLAIVASTLA